MQNPRRPDGMRTIIESPDGRARLLASSPLREWNGHLVDQDGQIVESPLNIFSEPPVAVEVTATRSRRVSVSVSVRVKITAP